MRINEEYGIQNEALVTECVVRSDLWDVEVVKSNGVMHCLL